MHRAWLVVVLAACGGSNDTKKDAAVQHDAHNADAKVFMDARPPDAPQHVNAVSCTGITPDATVTTMNFAFTPSSVTIPVNGVVEFMPESIHDEVPGHVPADTTIADPGLTGGFGQTVCLKFTVAGTYGYHCGPHLFNGTVTVQ